MEWDVASKFVEVRRRGLRMKGVRAKTGSSLCWRPAARSAGLAARRGQDQRSEFSSVTKRILHVPKAQLGAQRRPVLYFFFQLFKYVFCIILLALIFNICICCIIIEFQFFSYVFCSSVNSFKRSLRLFKVHFLISF
jgi:hypothetical protein